MGTSNVLNRRLPADSTGNNKQIFGGEVETELGQNLKTYVMTHKVNFSLSSIERIPIPLSSKLISVFGVVDTTQDFGDTSTVEFNTPQGLVGSLSFNDVIAGTTQNFAVASNENLDQAELISMTKTSIGAINTIVHVTFLLSID
jgi:hypothetical protein